MDVAEDEEEEDIMKLGRMGEPETTVGEFDVVDEGSVDRRECARTSRGRCEVTEESGG